MATVQHLVIVNKKKMVIICRIKPDLNITFKEIIKATEVAQVQISLIVGDNKIIMHILVPLTLLLQVLLTTLMQVLQIGVHNNNNNDRGATSPSNDPLHGIGGPMTRSKTKRMKQALQGLILKIKEKEDQCELRVALNWVALLQINEDALRPT